MHKPILRHTILPLVAFLLMLLANACGNSNNEANSSKTIKEYNITVDDSSYVHLMETFKENNYIPIKISYNGNTVLARMRVRGDTSRKYPKKSLKIKFDSLELEGLPKTLNLNAEYEDRTYVRQYLSTHLMQKSGQLCYQTEHVKVLLNGKFLGLFLQVENMDKNFLKRNNLSPKGNLYKATKDGACLSIFDDFNKKWEKKTNKKSDHNDLLELIEEINNVPDHKFENFIRNRFNFNEFVNMLALNMFMSNNSTYYHNYYLYHDLYNTGKWTLLPWDMDKTLSYYNWMPYTYHKTSSEWESDNPLVERSLLCEPIFKAVQTRIDELHNVHLNNKTMTPLIDSLKKELAEIIPLDTLDKIKTVEEWSDRIGAEKSYFDNHYALLQKQFSKQPHSFKVYRLDEIQTDKITFKWSPSKHPANKNITYIVSYGTDFLLTDSSVTNYITEISDTFYTIPTTLNEGTYYWKVTATDGEYYTDGFNTKNILKVKKGTFLPKVIGQNMTLTIDKSPYIASKKTIIKDGATLTINEGVEIHVDQDGTIDCSGNIIANGSAKHPIRFLPRNSANDWEYIYLFDPCQEALFNNVHFIDGVINCKAEKLTVDSCLMVIENKNIGNNVGRKVLIYSNKGKVHIKNSTFLSSGYGEGLVLFYSDVTTENCYFENTPDAIEYIGVHKGLIRNNYVTNSPDDAIDLNACKNVTIESNFLFHNKDKAISIGTEQYGASVENIQVKNNLIVFNKTAIAIKDSSVANIRNNTLFKNKYGIHAYKKREDYKIGGFATIENTIFDKQEETNVYADEFSEITVEHSSVYNKVIYGKKNFKADPKFIDAKSNNFHLKSDSKCHHKGNDKKVIGAFGKQSANVGFTLVHVKSDKENNTGDFIQLINYYNLPFDLSLYRINVVQGDQVKEFIFPIGTKLSGMEELYIVNNYQKFSALMPELTSIGGLPKLNANKTTIKLESPTGYLIEEYTYETVKEKVESITFKAPRINNNVQKKWNLSTTDVF